MIQDQLQSQEQNRLVQHLLSPGGWRGIRDVLDLLSGPTVDEIQKTSKKKASSSANPAQSDDSKVTLVLFLGGCTFAEISALRFLAQQEDSPTDYLIATTSIINGNNFIDTLTVNLSNPNGF